MTNTMLSESVEIVLKPKKLYESCTYFTTFMSMILTSLGDLYAVFTAFVGITLPFWGALLGFFGGFAFAPTTYFVSTSYLILLNLNICVHIISKYCHFSLNTY